MDTLDATEGHLFRMAPKLGHNIAYEWGTADLQGSQTSRPEGTGVVCAVSALEGYLMSLD